MSRLLIILSSLFLALACKETVKVENGEIPNEYLSLAAPYMGTYEGKIDRVPSVIHLTLNGNRVVMSGSLPLRPECQSSYGNLQSLVVEKNNSKITVHGANFAFDSNRCFTFGKEVNLEFDGNKLYYSLLLDSRRDWVCTPDIYSYVPATPTPPPTPPVPPPPNPCRWETVNTYAQGLLRK